MTSLFIDSLTSSGSSQEPWSSRSAIITHMCGRYRLSRRKQIIEERFNSVSGDGDWEPRYNIAPTQRIPVIRQHPTEPRKVDTNGLPVHENCYVMKLKLANMQQAIMNRPRR